MFGEMGKGELANAFLFDYVLTNPVLGREHEPYGQHDRMRMKNQSNFFVTTSLEMDSKEVKHLSMIRSKVKGLSNGAAESHYRMVIHCLFDTHVL